MKITLLDGLLDYDYIKNHYRLIAVDLSRQNGLDADLKSIHQIKVVGQLKNPDNDIIANKSMFLLRILEKVKETRLKFSQKKCNSIINNGKLSRKES